VVRLTLTGERTLPGIVEENYWFRRHEAAYRLLAPYCMQATVLEVGCGEGYGAELLRQAGAHRVIAVDYARDVVTHVRGRYPALAVVQANAVRLPCRTSSVDVVTAMQVVEHLWEQPRFVRECARALRPGGRVLLTTPNRLTFPASTNTFHARELTAIELAELAAPYFDVVVRGLRHSEALQRWEATHGSLVGAQLAGDWDAVLSSRVASIEAHDFELHDDVDAALDLVLVGIRR
jgi:2-polyprenyl-3-methyl-5-hydroxy-6-metoxy-1,4-benzoquinol methylase